MMRGEPLVVLADALAETVHTISRVGPQSGDPRRLAAQLGMPLAGAERTGSAVVA